MSYKYQKIKYTKDKYFIRFLKSDKIIQCREIFDLLINKTFVKFFTNILLNIPFSAFYFETPPLTINSKNPFYISITKTSFSITRSNHKNFKILDKFQNNEILNKSKIAKKNSSLAFSSPYNDGILIIPNPYYTNFIAKRQKFVHFKKFLEYANWNEIIYFWKLVSITSKLLLENNDEIWLSTHGHGVSYFHFRIYNNPKYYHTSEFFDTKSSKKLYKSLEWKKN